MTDAVVLVDARDREVGTADKLEAHRRGLRHRAFSAFVFDAHGRLILQRRAAGKYHGAGLWTNTCCSHPRPGETPRAAGERRLPEEMGFACALEPAFAFLYRAEVGSGLVENEYDHVLIGRHDGAAAPDPAEVAEWRAVAASALLLDAAREPARYTVWFRLALSELRARGLLPRVGE